MISSKNIQLGRYLEQIRECCSCVECIEDDVLSRAVNTALENWGTLTCGNWIDDHVIKQVIEVEPDCHGCCPKVKRVFLPESFIKAQTISVIARVTVGIEAVTVPIKWQYDTYKQELLIDISDLIDCCNSCKSYDLIIDYVVGTDSIPDELCRWFCEIAKVYIEVEKIECTACQSNNPVTIVDGEDLTATIKNLAMMYFNNVIAEYSLCEFKNYNDWSVVR